MLSSFYADDAVLRIIEHSNPPSRPARRHRQGGDHHVLA
jgi:hypothetical protein